MTPLNCLMRFWHHQFLAFTVIGILSAVVAAALAQSGSDSASALDAALHRLQMGDAAGAAKMLEGVTLKDPKNSTAWRALGTARQKLHDYDHAILDYEKSLAIEADEPQVFYSIGTAYAAKHDTRRAFEWLSRARSTHRYDMTELTVDADAAGLRGDPRFNELLPKRQDFESPFVESVRILQEWQGEAAEDQFGWIARNIGDVDNDGVNDFVTSAPTHGERGSNAGRIYVYSTRSGRLLWSADGRPGDQLGTGLERAGDTNADGIPDVVASGPAGSGVAYIYSGRDGRVLQSFKSGNPDESFGNHISGAGDVNHDGCADIIIGAPGKEGESKIAGRAYVHSGKDGRLLATLEGERIGDAFGSTVAGYSDAIGNEYLVIGAPRAGAQHRGRVYVYKGIEHRPAFTIEADDTGNALGLMFVSIVGDVDGDGVPDIYASDWSNSARGASTGRIYVHSGRTGARLMTLTGQTAGEGFGTSSSVAGDVDGDGRADLIIGAWQYRGAAVSGGRVYLYSGNDGGLLKIYTDRIPGDTLGFDSVGLGDVKKDGEVDFLITAAWSGVNGHHSGRVFVISSGVSIRRQKVAR